MKKKWEKPSLMVIVRNKTQEAVLAYCKNYGFSGSTGNNCITSYIACTDLGGSAS